MGSVSVEKSSIDDITFIKDSLTEIQKDISYMKSKIVDLDLVLTDDDSDALNRADDDFKKGKTKRL